jgi:hypothetical protein
VAAAVAVAVIGAAAGAQAARIKIISASKASAGL